MGLPEFAGALADYRHRVRGAGHDARRHYFFALAKLAFGIDLTSWEVEARVFRGWVDAILGLVILEFKTDLDREMPTALAEVEKYLADLHRRSPEAKYSAVITDGLEFHLYGARFGSGDNVILDQLQSWNLAPVDPSKLDAVTAAYLRLDALLASFSREKVLPTVDRIVTALGSDSAAFRSSLVELGSIYASAKDDPSVAVRYGQWNKYLGIVLGKAPEDAEFFLRQTYLATIDKLIAYLILEPDRPAVTDEDLNSVLTGRFFSDAGIHNFIEEDFFTWYLVPQVRQEGVAFLRGLSGTLLRFDFNQVSQDILKELYQQIVERDARHDIGEYYTPDWLAEMVLAEGVHLPEHPDSTVLDPACGSGTFLFLAVRMLREVLRAQGRQGSDILVHVLDRVHGIDVHPVAVITARTNYLLALADLLRGPRPSIAIPVYLADSLFPPEAGSRQRTVRTRRGHQRITAAGRLEEEPMFTWNPGEGRVSFDYPESLVEHPRLLDSLVNAMRAQLDLLPPKGKEEDIQKATASYLMIIDGIGASEGVALTRQSKVYVAEMFRQVALLHSQGKDTVWLFLLKNVPRPSVLRRRKFDVIVGNPPWVSLRFFRGARYADRVKRLALDEYNLQPLSQPHLVTQMELATLFFARAADLYLKTGGTIAFVMPRSIMVASQHERFNDFSFKGGSLPMRLQWVIDAERVAPLFNVPSCVLVATKDGSTNWPIRSTQLSGTLNGRNSSWEDARPKLQRLEVQIQRVQGKMLPVEQASALSAHAGRSPYRGEFAQGATIVPRVFWFVRKRGQQSRLGMSATEPSVETDEEAVRHAKNPWKPLRLNGPVESRFIYGTIPSGHLLPFGWTFLQPAVLPIMPEGTGYRVLDVNDAAARGYPLLAAWLRQAQKHWEAHAARTGEGHLKVPRIVDWLDYRGKLSGQNPVARFKVLYPRSATNLLGAVFDAQPQPASRDEAQGDLDPSAFVVDFECYVRECQNEIEAHYLAAVLNSPTVDSFIKPLQTRGAWGERDVASTVWSLGVPRFDANDAQHRDLAELSQQCHMKIATLHLRDLRIATARRTARGEVAEQLREIDRLVTRILP